MPEPRFVNYVNAPFGLNFYSPQHNLANTANQTWEGNVLLTSQAVIDAIQTTTDMFVASPFTDLIMGFFGLANTDQSSPWYNYPTPVITWNGVPVSPMTTPSNCSQPNQKWGLTPQVETYLARIVGSGKNLLASMQHDADLAYIKNNWSIEGFFNAFKTQVMEPFHFTGLDLDMETQWSTYPDILIELSNIFGTSGFQVSHAPYGAIDCSSPYSMLDYYLCKEQGAPFTPIVGKTMIRAPEDAPVNSISWLNIQYYSGGEQNGAKNTVSQYLAAIDAVKAIDGTGIYFPDYFNLVGLSPCICDPDFQLWNQPRDRAAASTCKPGTIQTDGCDSATIVMDTVDLLVQHFGKDTAGKAQFGGVFLYDYRYFNKTQVGYSYQVDTWNMIASALGL